jgi:hypothetical protein
MMPTIYFRKPVIQIAFAAGLLLLAGLVYWPVRHFGFLNYDDQTYVWMNRFVQMGFSRASIHYAFTATFGGWSPLVWISFLIDRQLFAATAAGMHIENVIWHGIGGIMLWILLNWLTAAPWRSWIVAALFVCHPMHVESVAWISERKDVLSTVLLLGSMLAYCKYCKTPSVARRRLAYCSMLLLFVFSLMTKAMGVTLPLLLLLLDYWPLRRMPVISLRNRSFRRLLAEKIPIAGVAVAFSIIALIAQDAGGATSAGASLPLLDRIDNGIVCYVIYIVKLVIPTNLAAFYPHPGSRPVAVVIAAGGLLALLTWLAGRYRNSAPFLLVGWLWFLLALVPVIGIVQIGGQAMADRYSYLPSIGLFMSTVWGLGDLLVRCGSPTRSWLRRGMASLLAVAVITTYSILARRQVWYWQDTETLFVHSYEVTGPNPVACYIIGTSAYFRGDLRAAVDNLDVVIEQDPGNDRAAKLLGDIWVRSDVNKATDYYKQAVDLKPAKLDYRIALAAAYARQGDAASLQAAADQLRAALRLDPANAQARAGLDDVQTRIRHSR